MNEDHTPSEHEKRVLTVLKDGQLPEDGAAVRGLYEFVDDPREG